MKCPECNSKRIIWDSIRGVAVCADCGYVLKERFLDESQEWRAFDAEQMLRRARGGAPLTVTKHDKGLATELGKGLGELYKVPPSKRPQYYRLTTWQKRLMDSRDRNLSFALSELQRIVSFLGLPANVHERVARHYEEALDKGLIRGRSIESILAALVYCVSRDFKCPRTFDEIAEATGVSKRDIGRAYRYIARELGLRIIPANPNDFIPRFASLLNLSEKVKKKAIDLLEEARKKGISSGKGAAGLAAAAIYLAAQLCVERRTQKEIGEKCGITEVTLRNRCKELVERLGLMERVLS